jgi:hypothetical protein
MMRTFLKTSLTAVSVTLGCFASFDAFADLDVYKCKDAQGHLNYTDSPCVGKSQAISHSKIAQRPNSFTTPLVFSEKESQARLTSTKHRSSTYKPNVNVFAVNEQYKIQVFDEKFKHPRTSEQDKLNKNLDTIEAKRQRALKGNF